MALIFLKKATKNIGNEKICVLTRLLFVKTNLNNTRCNYDIGVIWSSYQIKLCTEIFMSEVV